MTTKPQSFLSGLGFQLSEIGTPFWKPESRKQTVTMTDLKPTPIVKELKDGGKIKLIATAQLKVKGVAHTWEISSKRAMGALEVAVTKLPIVLDIQAHGSGTDTTFTIVEHVEQTPMAKGSLAPPCDAPGCTLKAGHHGVHTTRKEAPDAASR